MFKNFPLIKACSPVKNYPQKLCLAVKLPREDCQCNEHLLSEVRFDLEFVQVKFDEIELNKIDRTFAILTSFSGKNMCLFIQRSQTWNWVEKKIPGKRQPSQIFPRVLWLIQYSKLIYRIFEAQTSFHRHRKMEYMSLCLKMRQIEEWVNDEAMKSASEVVLNIGFQKRKSL